METAQKNYMPLILVVAAVVLFAIGAWFVVTRDQKDTARKLLESYNEVPQVASVQDIPATVDTEVLNAPEVTTCMDAVMNQKPAAAPTPVAQVNKANLEKFSSDMNAAVTSSNAWASDYQAALKSCYDTNLKAKYGASSNEYQQKRWQ